MTLALLAKFGPWIFALLAGLFGVFKHQQAATAKAETQVAKQEAATAAAVAESKSAALEKVTAAGQDRAVIDAAVAVTPPDKLDDALKSEGFVG